MIITHNGSILQFNNQIISSDSENPTNSIVTDQLFMKLDATNYSGSGQWLDETANGNNGTINGATWLPTDGGIFDFNGINNTISIPHNSSLSLNTTTEKTIQVWVKLETSATSTNRMIVFSKLSGAYNFDGYFGGINISGQTVVATNGTNIAKTTTSTSTITLNTWYLFTFISQITNVSNTTKVYINETEFATNAHGTDTYNESNSLTLGYMPSPLTGLGLIQYLDGKIGACYFYTKGLSLTEISTNFNATKSKYGL